MSILRGNPPSKPVLVSIIFYGINPIHDVRYNVRSYPTQKFIRSVKSINASVVLDLYGIHQLIVVRLTVKKYGMLNRESMIPIATVWIISSSIVPH